MCELIGDHRFDLAIVEGGSFSFARGGELAIRRTSVDRRDRHVRRFLMAHAMTPHKTEAPDAAKRKWTKPAYKDVRLGFEYTMYAMTR